MYPILALLGIMFLTWSITIWASMVEEDQPAANALSYEKIRKTA